MIIYKSDTAPGSSGSPVFNNEWQLIALHSAGVAKKNDRGDYVDKEIRSSRSRTARSIPRASSG